MKKEISKFNIPDPEDSWAQVELYRWCYGELPFDCRPIIISQALRNLADAIEKGDKDNFPTPFNVISILRYLAKLDIKH